MLLIITLFSSLTYNRNFIWLDSLRLADDVVKKSPHKWRSYFCRAGAYFDKKQYEEAIKDYTRALSISPFESRIYDGRAEAYAQKSEYEKAVSDYSAAIVLVENYGRQYQNVYLQRMRKQFSVELYNKRGIAYSLKGEYDKALVDFNQSIELLPDLADSYNNRGIVYRFKGDYDRALFDYSRAIELNLDFPQAYNNRGYIYFLKKEYDKAINDYNQAIRINPGYGQCYFNRAQTYLKLGKSKQAEQDIVKARSLGFYL